ncbi:MAG TPA: alpha/beta fold hydrolase [Candidatus Saccharimonadales bacterium]|nr:alpha/beta fold hydrolase [Candidatus Saccharimonadales bacterium]
MRQWFDSFWHRALRRPYRLARPLDSGQGQLIVLLHGIGRTGRIWQHLTELLAGRPYRLVAFDLLGFGASPKPVWPDYDIDDHADAVISGLERLRPAGPAVLVGHSMGCLVAVRVARRRPDLVKHLVLYEMPLYAGLPEKRRYRARLNLYFRLYQRIVAYQPSFDPAKVRLAERLARRIAGFEVDETTWQPFIKSLQNTIMNQTAADDIKQLAVPMDVIYGSYDMLVIRGKARQVFGEDSAITTHRIRERHLISTKASRFIVSRIRAAIEPPEAIAHAE